MKRKVTIQMIAWICFIVAVISVAFGVVMQFRIGRIGKEIGKHSGEAVGVAIGSYKGMSSGYSEGRTAGKEAGMSAEDTYVSPNLAPAIENVGKLEVLVAGVRLQNFSELGDTYKALYVLKGNAIFSVDLSKAEIMSSTDNTIEIQIPEPELEVSIDNGSVEKLAETQKFSWGVDAEDGITAYLNGMSIIKERAEETIMNYETLMNTARETAESQVTRIAKTICGTDYSIRVKFNEDN